ncbi:MULTISPECIES: hypothetical protein [Providencia]|uniref:hypothetical protein n=1 Tax=Providencia TaxID=586 RepID=UPI000F77D58B|nr:YbjQ family protein [Providencia rettgeri]UQZ14213.1 YbjQ family protein [Providencia stuartii]
MGLFDSKLKLSCNFDNRVFTTSNISNAKSIKNLGLVKVSMTIDAGKYSHEDEQLKDKLMSISVENGGNAIINFRLETGTMQTIGSRWITSYIIAYGDAVFIEYND